MTKPTTTLIERKIARSVIRDLVGAGYEVTVNDGEEDVLENSIYNHDILEAMFGTDEDYLIVSLPGAATRAGWVRFVYGNSGWDVVNDYTTNLEEALKPSTALADRLEMQS